MFIRLIGCLCLITALASAETLGQAVERYVDTADAETARDVRTDGTQFVRAADEAKGPWTTLNAGLGVTVTDGNSDTVTVSATGNAVREWGPWKLALGVAIIYAEASKVQSTSEWIFTERLDRKLDDKSSIFQTFYFEHDEEERLTYRMRFTVGYARRLITKKDFWLDFDIGGGVLHEQFRNPETDETEAIAQFGFRWEWKITETVLYKQTIQIYPSLSDGGEFQMIWLSEFSTPVGDGWKFVLTILDTYDSAPPAGTKENDIKLILTLTVDFLKTK